ELSAKVNLVVAAREELDRELTGLARAIEEDRQARHKLYPELEAMDRAAAAAERKRRIDGVAEQFRLAREREAECETALVEARQATQRALFNLQAVRETEAVEAHLAAQEHHKTQ